MKQITYIKHNTIIAQKQIKFTNTVPTFLDLIHEHDIAGFDAPCGGNGTCGKCRIRIISGDVSSPAENERTLLTAEEIDGGIRLACSSSPLGDVTIELSADEVDSSSIASTSSGTDDVKSSAFRFRRHALQEIPESSIADQRSLLSKVITSFTEPDTSEMIDRETPLDLINMLHPAAGSDRDIIIRDDTPYMIIDAGKQLFAAAIDIGTTTLVIYLVDLTTGDVQDTFSALNAQKSFGADVISRIAYASKSGTNRKHAKEVIVGQIEQGILTLVADNAIDAEQILQITIAGNTTMLHLLVGADTSGIAASPFIPVFTEMITCRSEELGMKTLIDVKVELLPSVAAYVGADITAGIHVSGIHKHATPSLLLDIGTNGEMALGIDGKIICCSTAAGPAFEGANITCGTGGIQGAIDTVTVTEEGLSYTTIGNRKPVGICGSGIIDAVAQLLRQGLIDYTGRLLGTGETTHPNIQDIDGESVVLLASAEASGSGTDIILTQKDIREVQLAKSAIAAGVRTLIEDAGISEEQIEHLYMAGGFGSFIAPESAGTIGLIPNRLVARTIAIGNSSGEGAIRFCCWRDHALDILHIAQKCSYIELSAHRKFQEFYIEEMFFNLEE